MSINYMFRNSHRHWGNDITCSPREAGYLSEFGLPAFGRVWHFSRKTVSHISKILGSSAPYSGHINLASKANCIVKLWWQYFLRLHRDQHNRGWGSFRWDERANVITVSQLLLSIIPLSLPAHFQHSAPTSTDHEKAITLAKWCSALAGLMNCL